MDHQVDIHLGALDFAGPGRGEGANVGGEGGIWVGGAGTEVAKSHRQIRERNPGSATTATGERALRTNSRVMGHIPGF